MAKNATVVSGGIGGAIILGFLLVMAFNFFAMLLFGAAASEWHYCPGPSFWQTYFGMWTIALVGAAFNGARRPGIKS